MPPSSIPLYKVKWPEEGNNPLGNEDDVTIKMTQDTVIVSGTQDESLKFAKWDDSRRQFPSACSFDLW